MLDNPGKNPDWWNPSDGERNVSQQKINQKKETVQMIWLPIVGFLVWFSLFIPWIVQ